MGTRQRREVVVHDYLDGEVEALRGMAGKRIRGYGSLGYTVERTGILSES